MTRRNDKSARQPEHYCQVGQPQEAAGMSEIQVPPLASDGRPWSAEIGAAASTVLRVGFLVVLAIFLILVMLPLALAAGGSAGVSI
jgi:hypothetical protein